MAKRRVDEIQSNGTDILSQVPTVEYLEERFKELMDEARRVKALLQCIRSIQMHDDIPSSPGVEYYGLEKEVAELAEDEPVVSAAGQV